MFYDDDNFLNRKKRYFKKKNFDDLLKQQSQASLLEKNNNKNNDVNHDLNLENSISLESNNNEIDKELLESNNSLIVENKVIDLVSSLDNEIKNINLNTTHDITINEYINYKERLKVIVYKEIENKIETMKILYIINKNRLYKKYDNYNTFQEFVEKEFKISKATAFKYINIFNSILKKEITIESVIENKIEKSYKNIVSNRVLLKNKKPKLGIKKYIFTRLKIQKDIKAYSFLDKNPDFLQFLIDNLSDKVVNKHFKVYKKLYLKKDVKSTVLKEQIDNKITNEKEIDSNQINSNQ